MYFSFCRRGKKRMNKFGLRIKAHRKVLNLRSLFYVGSRLIASFPVEDVEADVC
jgi:hypothetical protein